VSPVYCKKIDSIRTKLTEEVHFEVSPYILTITQVWTRQPHPMLCARRKHQRAAACPYHSGRSHLRQGMTEARCKGVRTKTTLGVFINSEWSSFGNSGPGHVRNSELGHDVRRASRTGGTRTWGRNRAVKTNRLACLSVCLSCPVCNVGVLWPNGWTDPDEKWHAVGLGLGLSTLT